MEHNTNNTTEHLVRNMAKDLCLVKHNCNDVCNPIDTCKAYASAKKGIQEGYRKLSPEMAEMIDAMQLLSGDQLAEIRNKIMRYCALHGDKWVVFHEDSMFSDEYAVCTCPKCDKSYINAQEETQCPNCKARINGFIERHEIVTKYGDPCKFEGAV